MAEKTLSQYAEEKRGIKSILYNYVCEKRKYFNDHGEVGDDPEGSDTILRDKDAFRAIDVFMSNKYKEIIKDMSPEAVESRLKAESSGPQEEAEKTDNEEKPVKRRRRKTVKDTSAETKDAQELAKDEQGENKQTKKEAEPEPVKKEQTADTPVTDVSDTEQTEPVKKQKRKAAPKKKTAVLASSYLREHAADGINIITARKYLVSSGEMTLEEAAFMPDEKISDVFQKKYTVLSTAEADFIVKKSAFKILDEAMRVITKGE